MSGLGVMWQQRPETNDISWLLAEETDEPLVRTVKPRVTVLTPVYNEEANLARYERQVTRVLLAHPDHEFEFLLIDDGSTDRSWALIQELCARNSRFQGLRLSRNFGAHVALCAGFAHAEGEAVVTLACDLQDPPQVVLQFLTEWRAGAQIVWGHRRTRQDESWRVVASRLFRGLLQRHALPRGSRFTTGSFFLVDKKVAECYREFQEANRITFALIAWTGFTQAVVEYDRLARTAGQTGWTFGKMMKAMYDAFLGFSPLPIQLITRTGVLLFLGSCAVSSYLLWCWMVGRPVPGYTSIMLALMFLFGVQFLMLGVVGEYMHRIYVEVVRRPLYFVSDRAGRPRKVPTHDN